jgi:homoserine dehydrogenase
MLVEVIKFGSSVLHSHHALHIAVDEIYRRYRCGRHVLAVVSAFDGATDILMTEATRALGLECPEATAAYVSTGEQKTAALLSGTLQISGIPSRVVDPREIALIAEGHILESAPVRVDVVRLTQLWEVHPVLVLPGFYGIDLEGRVALFGRGGSDLSALFLAARLEAECRLAKDVQGVFNADPVCSTSAHRFSALSWETAIKVAGPLIQPKALRFAHQHSVTFEVGRPNETTCTRVGHGHDEWALPTTPSQTMGVALVGCGTVGRGVYEWVRRYPVAFAIQHVVVRDAERYSDLEKVTTDASVITAPDVDIVIICATDTSQIPLLIEAALAAGKFVITANKAALAAHGPRIVSKEPAARARLWYSAAVGGAVPMLETLSALEAPVREIRGIINGTCGAVLDACASGKTLEEAIRVAQTAGFAEADPSRDLSGRDSADKLILLVATAFGRWLAPDDIHVIGVDRVAGDPEGLKLIARAKATLTGTIIASVAPERPPANSFLGQARGAENRLEIELQSGDVIRLRGQGAGRWPTTASIMGDLHEITRSLAGTGATKNAHGIHSQDYTATS